jgi:predicted amidohydrolase YtcJ
MYCDGIILEYVGKAADLIILDRNLFETPTDQINQTRVEATYLQGIAVYER